MLSPSTDREVEMPQDEGRRRGRPGYGERKTVTVRVPAADMELLQLAAARRGMDSVATLMTLLTYESLRMRPPAWALGSKQQSAGGVR